MTELDRFFDKVNKTDTCWIWTASLNHKGYGQFQSSTYKRPMLAHRFSYLMFVGQIPLGLVLDHTCEVKACVNPEHLDPVSTKENLRRGMVGQKNAAHHRAKTHCRNGHEYLPETTKDVLRKGRSGFSRLCMLCSKQTQQRNIKRKGS